MINTLQKRAASSSFGFMPGAGTRPPSGTSNEFLRGATVSCYNDDALGTPFIGWSIGRTERVWIAGRASRVFQIPEKM